MTPCPDCAGLVIRTWDGDLICLLCGREPGQVPTLATAETRRAVRYRVGLRPRRVRGGIRGEGRPGRPTKAERAAWMAGAGVQ